MTRAEARHVQAAVAVELDEFWCSDCLTRALFERVAAAGEGSEWACTACGAAYFDAIDLVLEVAGPLAGRDTA